MGVIAERFEKAGRWREDLHPRDPFGRFTDGDFSMTARFTGVGVEYFSHKIHGHYVEVKRDNDNQTVFASDGENGVTVDLRTGKTFASHISSMGESAQYDKITRLYGIEALAHIAMAARKHMTAEEAKRREGRKTTVRGKDAPYVTRGPGEKSAELSAQLEEDFQDIGFHPKGISPVTIRAGFPGRGAAGVYHRDEKEIVIAAEEKGLINRNDLRTTLAHEYGHHLDSSMPSRSSAYYESEARRRPGMKNVMREISKTPTMRKIRKQAREGVGGRRGAPGRQRSFSEYLAKRREVFARAFAQWVATKQQEIEGDQAMMNAIGWRIGDALSGSGQWTTEEFKPVAEAFDAFFRAEGWLD